MRILTSFTVLALQAYLNIFLQVFAQSTDELPWVQVDVEVNRPVKERTAAQSTNFNLRDATIDQKRGFLAFCARFNRNYSSTTEMDTRFGLYLKTKEMIDNAPPSSFTMGLNSFADRTDAEK